MVEELEYLSVELLSGAITISTMFNTLGVSVSDRQMQWATTILGVYREQWNNLTISQEDAIKILIDNLTTDLIYVLQYKN
jgi:hypothetical protein